MSDYESVLREYSRIIDEEALRSVILAIHKLYDRLGSLDTRSFEATLEDLVEESGVDSHKVFLALAILKAESLLEASVSNISTMKCLRAVGKALAVLDYKHLRNELDDEKYRNLIEALLQIANIRVDENAELLSYADFYRVSSLLKVVLNDICYKLIRSENINDSFIKKLIINDIKIYINKLFNLTLTSNNIKIRDFIKKLSGLDSVGEEERGSVARALHLLLDAVSGGNMESLKSHCKSLLAEG